MPIIGEIRAFAFGASGRGFRSALDAYFLPCDGRAIEQSFIEDLAEVLDDRWGSEIRGVNICLPNLSGTFLRGYSLGDETIDPLAYQRVSPRPDLANTGSAGRGSNNVGSFQEDDVQPHLHRGRGKKASGTASSHHAQANTAGGPDDTWVHIFENDGIETRPKNHSVMYMIYVGPGVNQDVIDQIKHDYLEAETNIG